jgi:hypothetical protein
LSLSALHTPESLRSRSETLAGSLPALMADAQHLAATVLLGTHGRKRAGTGDEFWQYRPRRRATRRGDWRRSRSDGHFVRQTEWQAAQSVMIGRTTRLDDFVRQTRMAGGAAVHGGERVGLTNLADAAARRAGAASAHGAGADGRARDRATTARRRCAGDAPGQPGALLLRFPRPLDAVDRPQLGKAADRGVRGVLSCRSSIPTKRRFPMTGARCSSHVGRSLRFETLKAGDLRDRYLERLAERKDQLEARATHRLAVPLCTIRPTGGAALLGFTGAEKVLRAENARVYGFPRFPGKTAAALMVPRMIAGLAFTAPTASGAGLRCRCSGGCLRAVPPAPIRRRFPGVALLLGLKMTRARPTRRRGGSAACACWPWPRPSWASRARS